MTTRSRWLGRRPSPSGLPAGGQPPLAADEDLRERIATARWHTTRYDSLRGSLTTRASFVVSVNAIVVTGTTLLLAQAQPKDLAGGRVTFAVTSAGAAVAIAFAAASVWQAIGALVAGRPWRTQYGKDVPYGAFYQHSDTFKQFSSYRTFRAALSDESLERQLDAAAANLWVVMRTHAYRYAFLRRAVRSLAVSISLFVTVAAAVIAARVVQHLQ